MHNCYKYFLTNRINMKARSQNKAAQQRGWQPSVFVNLISLKALTHHNSEILFTVASRMDNTI